MNTDAALQPEALTPSTRKAVVEMLVIAAPTVATMTSYTLMQFVDGWMVSRIEPASPDFVAAQGNGGNLAWVPMAFVMGLMGIVNTYVSQNLGAGKPERGPAYAWNALWMCVLAAILLVPYGLALPYIFAHPALGHTPSVQALETPYAQILVFGAIFSLCTRALAQFFYGLHRPGIVLIAAVIGNLTNLGLNYLLIYGRPEIGIPAFGLAGAAMGTVVGTMVELAIPLSVFLSKAYDRQYGTRRAWRVSLGHIRDIFRTGWPAALMFGNEMVCWAIFMTGLCSRFGAASSAASWITLRYMQLSFMPAVGISVAMTAMVGKALGAGRPDIAAQRAKIGMMLTMGYMGLCALAFVVFRSELVGVFIASDMPAGEQAAVLAVGVQLMIVAAIFQMFDGLGITLIGVMRGAGDTMWPGVVTFILSWVCIIGGGYAFVYWMPQLGSLGPWIGAGAYIILLGIALFWRFRSGRWKRMDLLKHAEGSQSPDDMPANPTPERGPVGLSREM